MMHIYSKIALFVLIALVGANISFAECPGEWLGDFLDFENPRVIKQLKEIESKGSGYKTTGINLCDKSILFPGWIFQKDIHVSSRGQHIYLFKDTDTLKAVTWVEDNGKPLNIPSCPYGERCLTMAEGATVISGDIYTWKEVQPGHGIVIIIYPTSDWVEDLTNR